MEGNIMGKQTEYLKGKEEFKSRILKYLTVRKDSISEMLQKKFNETGEIDPIILEVMLTYNAMFSDINGERLD